MTSTKTLLVAAVLSAFAATSFAQAPASAADGASKPAKTKKHHAKKKDAMAAAPTASAAK